MKSHFFFLIFSALLLGSCTREATTPEPVIHQAQWLDYDSTLIWPDDYLRPGEVADSIIILGKIMPSVEIGKSFTFRTPEDAPPLFSMQIWVDGVSTDVVLKRSSKKSIHYTFNPGGKTYASVGLKGEFNGWTATRTALTLAADGTWQTDLILAEGKYQYLIVADGIEMLDPACADKVDNNSGGFNSLLKVGSPNKSTVPVLLTKSTDKREIVISTSNKPVSYLVLWNNTILSEKDYRVEGEELRISIPSYATKHQRSFIRVFAWNAEGMGNDLLIPLEKGKVITDASLLNRFDLHAAMLYNVFVDRFVNGEPNNDKHLPDSIVLPPANYYGGDISGVLKRLEEGYFSELGVNTLWLSPLVKNADGPYGFWPEPETKFSAYHGYWPTSFTEIDSHFGKGEDLRQLVDKAHGRQMNVMLDIVAHHVHQDHPFYKANPEKVTPLYLPDGTLNTERWDDHRLTTWFDVFLPTLDLQNPLVAETVSDSTLWWILEYKVDGFRHDAAKHVPLEFWRLLSRKVKDKVVYPEARPFYQLGETYGGTELIGSYLGSGLMDAQFDFNVFDAALSAFAGAQKFDLLYQRIMESQRQYGSHNLMGNITGNQDRARFISYAGGDLKFEENAKAAGWTRKIGVGDPVAYKRLSMMMAFIMTMPGVPVIYYGDEFGMPGGNDPDSRRMMRFANELSPEEKSNLEISKKLTALRRSNMALMYGDFCYFSQQANTLVYARTYFGSTVITLFNNSSSPAVVEIDLATFAPGGKFSTAFGSGVKQQGNKIMVDLPANGFEVLIKK
jgi:cyclomaltodextrinase / maltogenic alpha-amylase / neopullulanase